MKGEDEAAQTCPTCQHVMLPGRIRGCCLCSDEICFSCSPKNAVLCKECEEGIKEYSGRLRDWPKFQMLRSRNGSSRVYRTGDEESGTEKPEETGESDSSPKGEPGFWEREAAEAAARMGVWEAPSDPGFFEQQAAEAVANLHSSSEQNDWTEAPVASEQDDDGDAAEAADAVSEPDWC